MKSKENPNAIQKDNIKEKAPRDEMTEKLFSPPPSPVKVLFLF